MLAAQTAAVAHRQTDVAIPRVPAAAVAVYRIAVHTGRILLHVAHAARDVEADLAGWYSRC